MSDNIEKHIQETSFDLSKLKTIETRWHMLKSKDKLVKFWVFKDSTHYTNTNLLKWSINHTRET